jgi:hypothetical protein
VESGGRRAAARLVVVAIIAGTFTFTVQAGDAGWEGNVARRSFTVSIRAREKTTYASTGNDTPILQMLHGVIAPSTPLLQRARTVRVLGAVTSRYAAHPAEDGARWQMSRTRSAASAESHGGEQLRWSS